MAAYPVYRWKDKGTFAILFSKRIQTLGQVHSFGISQLSEFVTQVSEQLPSFLESGMEFSLGIAADWPTPGRHEIIIYRVRRDRRGFETQAARNQIGSFVVDLRSPSI